MVRYSKAYTPVDMADLDRARAAAKREMAEIYKRSGVKLKMRTFYLGPRRPRSHDMHVRKAVATGAKLAFYKRVTGSSAFPTSGYEYYTLIGYY